jgi:hypothetical protein
LPPWSRGPLFAMSVVAMRSSNRDLSGQLDEAREVSLARTAVPSTALLVLRAACRVWARVSSRVAALCNQLALLLWHPACQSSQTLSKVVELVSSVQRAQAAPPADPNTVR